MNQPDPIDLRVPATDGYLLAATLYAPLQSPRSVAVLSCGMGMSRGFYVHYASYLASRDIAVVTYDYRGVAGSRPARLRRFPATCTDWGEKDLAGVIDWAAQRYPGAPLFTVGHSLGAQIVGLAPNSGRLSGMLAIASPSGYWRHYPFPQNTALYALWRMVLPATAAAFRMFPARALRLGHDVPEHVMREWSGWCRSPHYLAGPPGTTRRARFERITAPLLAYSFSDDAYAPYRAAEALLDLYPNARRDHRHLVPRDVGGARIGHFGFFREGPIRSLWSETADWLTARRA